jgi:hypothetical protein
MTQSPERQQSPAKARRFWLWVVGVVPTVAVVVCCIGGVALLARIFHWQPQGTPQIVVVLTPTVMPWMAGSPSLADAYASCGSKGQLTSTKDVLIMDTSTGTVNRTDIQCILDMLNAPPSVSAEIDQTPAGKISGDQWGSNGPLGTSTFSIRWSTDDNGNLNLSIIDNRFS